MKDQLTRKSLEDGTEVKLYRNLRTKTNSVMVNVPNFYGKKRWIVIGYIDEIRIDNAQFIVGEKTRQKVIKEKKKYVHAFVKGNWRSSWKLSGDQEQVYYNPFKSGNFHVTDYYGGKAIDPNWKGIVYFSKDSQTNELTVWKQDKEVA
jgi:hypothetical protein